MTCGYWNSPDLTAQIFRPESVPGERLLHTGDLFTKDTEGFLYFVGRKDDMIKTKGERVSPREVEVVLREMDGIAEAAVVGVADEILGQVLKAFVVPAPGAMLRERDILRHCGRNLEPFNVPKHIEFVVELFQYCHAKIAATKIRAATVRRNSHLPIRELRSLGRRLRRRRNICFRRIGESSEVVVVAG